MPDCKEKLLNPKWQKLKLEIMQRDQWTCQICCGKEKTLHVHHKFYEENLDPWEYPLYSLITLCKDCHKGETLHAKNVDENFMKIMKSKFFAKDLELMMKSFAKCDFWHCHDVVAAAICKTMETKKLQKFMIDKYFELIIHENKAILIKKWKVDDYD